jgi:hypothetical protein
MQQPLMTLALLGWVSTLHAGLAWDALPQAVQGAPAAQALGAEAQAASARQAGLQGAHPAQQGQGHQGLLHALLLPAQRARGATWPWPWPWPCSRS